MKRIITFVVSLAILFLIYQFIVMLFISEHHIKYILIKDDVKFEVQEDYKKRNKEHIYDISIIKDDISIYFTLKEDLHKQKQIIKDLEFYESDGLLCVLPLSKGSIQSEIICSDGKTNYTSTYLRSINNSVVLSFIDTLKGKEILHPSYSYTENAEEYFKDTIYQKNILEGYTLGTWNYHGVNLYTNKEKKNLTPLDYDRYENTHSLMSDVYWIFPNYDQKYDFRSIYLINMEDLARKFIGFEDITISYNSYFNGMVDGKIYVTDKSNFTQYAINPRKDAIELVGSKQLDGKYFDGSFHDMSIYDLVNEEKRFSVSGLYDQELEEFGTVRVHKSNEGYYFKTSDNAIYYSSDSSFSKVTLLFQDSKMVDYRVAGDAVYYLSGDTIYQYSMYDGLKRVVVNNEFLYNSKNIFEVYKKS